MNGTSEEDGIMGEYKVILAGESFVFNIKTKKISLDHQKFLKKISDNDTDLISDEIMDINDIHKANKEVAHKIIQIEHDKITHEHFDFLLSIAGIKGKELATYLGVNSSQISQWRRGQKDISKAYWKLSCIILWDIIKNGNLTLDHDLFNIKGT